MNRKKQHFWLCGFIFFFYLNALASNIVPPKTTHAHLIDSVFLHLSSATANVGDVVSISVKVGNFNNIDQMNFNVNWNAAYLEFQSVSNFGLPSISNTNFNILSTPSGKLLFFWIPPSPQSAPDSTVLFKINLKIKSYSGLPIPVFVTNTSAYNDLGLAVAVSSHSGSVKVNNNGNCAGRPAGLTCATAPLLCVGDFPYCNTLPRDNATFTQPTPCGSIENYHFIQFEAATDEITFRVKASNCDGGNGGNGVGIQIRVYETTDCQSFKIKYCRSSQPISPGSSDTTALKELVVGNRYYFMVDGQKGDVCDYLISIESGSVGGKPVVTASNINGTSSVCKNASKNAYTVSNTTEAIAYEWKTTNGGVIASGQNTPSVFVNWGTVSDSICVKIVGNCFESDWACKAVAISPPVESNLDATICSGSTYNLGSQTFNTTGNYRVTFPNASYKGCDSIVNLNLKVLDIQISASKTNNISCKTPTASLNGSATVSPNSVSVSYEWKNASNALISNALSLIVNQSGTYTFTVKAILNGTTCQKSTQVTITAAPPSTEGNVSAVICKGSTYPLGSQSFNTTGNYKVTLTNANYLGCDSVVNLDLKVIDIQISSSKSGDLSCQTQSVTLTGSATVLPNNISVTYEWKNASNAIISNALSLIVNQSGTYTFTVKAILNGTTCEKSTQVTITAAPPSTEGNVSAVICKGSTYLLGSQSFNTTGNYKVTLTNANYLGCDSVVNLDLKVIDIQISSSKSGDLSCQTQSVTLTGSATVLPNNTSVTYEWKNASNALISNALSLIVNQSGTYTFTVKAILNGTTCQKSTQVTITAAPPSTEGNVSAVICKGSTYPLGSQSFNTTGNYKVTLTNANYLGCDSVVNLDLKVIDIQISSSKSGDLSCQTQSVTLTGSATVLPNNISVTYEWKNASNAIISNALSLIVNQSGTYTFTVKVILNGTTCEKSSQVTVLKTGNAPSRPELQGDVISCENKTVNYNIVNIAQGVSKYNWFITNGTITSGVGTPSVSVAWGQSSTGKVCVNAENGCSVSDTTCLTIEVGKIPNTVIISGSATVCPASISTYNISPTIGNVIYQWTVPSGATIKKGQNTPSIDVDWSNSLGGQVCVTPSNYCGLAAQSCFNVTIKNAPPDSTAIKSSMTVCPNAVDTLSVAPDAGIIEYIWTAPSNTTIVSGQGTPSVIVRFNSGSEALFLLQIKNTCNLTRQMSRLVKIKSVLPDSLPILGNLAVCSNDTSSFGVSGNSSITAYLWSVPAGATIINGQGTMTIQVSWGTATGGKIGVELTNACQLKRQILSDNIILKNAAIEKPTIVGSSDNCPNSKSNYSVTANPKYTRYTWTVPSNGTLLSGQGTNAIQVQWGNTGDSNICIEVENECRTKTTECLPVTVKTGIDSLQITGSIEVCSGGTAVYTAQKDPDAVSYLWTVPAGATIITGRGTNSIKVQFGTTGGKVLVLPIGGCAANSSQMIVAIKQVPNSTASVIGKTAVCQGDIEKYTAAPVLGIRRYNWNVPAGAAIIGNDSTNEITIRWASGIGGLVRIKTQNECAESAEKSVSVAVSNVPQPNAGKDDSICGKQYILRGVSSVGIGIWTIVEKPTTATLTFADAKNPKTAITVSKSGKYILRFEEINNTCSAADSVVINFKENPQLTLINDDCNLEGTQYVLKVNINNGIAPFTFSGGLVGTMQGNNFTSAPIANGASYIFTAKDAFGCLSDTIKGKKTCPCYTQAAILKDNVLNLCYGLTGKTEVIKAPVLDGDDGLEFVLHEGSINAIGTILLRNNIGEFAFDASKMQYGKMYFIHQIAGNLSNGLVNPTDRCYVVSNGTSIIFKDKIAVNLKGDTAICSNTTATLVFKTTDKGVFNIVYKNQNQNQIFNSSNIKNNSLINVTPSLSSTYKLIEATDATGCKAEIMDSVRVNLRAKPAANAGVDKTVCIFNSSLDATISTPFSGTWKSLSGAQIVQLNNPKTDVRNLVNGKNIFILTVKDSVCPAFQAVDSVSIFLPLLPKAVNLALEMTAGDTISAKIVEEAPAGTYSVTRIDNPAEGRFDLFSNGQFNYISNPNFSGVVRFRVMICSEACTRLCDTGEVRILIRPKIVKPQDITIEVPNAITPNEDGKNDMLVIDNIEKYPQNELIIFNRWGDILYKAKPYANDWNGTNQQGKPLPEGTYYYLLRLDINNAKILRGDMTILR